MGLLRKTFFPSKWASNGKPEDKPMSFGPAQLKCIADSSKFSLQEIQTLYSAFLRQGGGRQPLVGGLSTVELLGLFGLTNLLGSEVGDRLASNFWRERTLGGRLDVGFAEFIHVLGVWTRGSTDERTAMLFSVYDRQRKGYVTKQDIVVILESLISCSEKTELRPQDWNSEHFKSTVVLQRHSVAEIAEAANSVANEWADAAIR
eukprot:GHVT01048224.1.p1 GENE.GHVT01048224.1~~GHVT01048224.1.p1  ORF type:complete len:204 (+),score=31.84 GHVT01048224.1:1603-2214(+)